MLVSLLQRAGISKAELARRLGLSANNVSGWHDNAPRYATAYLELLINFNRYAP